MFWYLLILASALLFVYPYVLYPLVLRLLPRRSLSAGNLSSLRYALLFCAHNEEKSLPATLANLRKIKASWPELQIYAYSDNSSDRTYELLAGASDVLTAVEGRERAGKPAGMRKLTSMAQGADVFIFTDANVIVEADTIRRFEHYFSRPDVGCVAGTLHYVNEDESDVAHVGGLYWRIEEKIKRLESETGSTMGADGSIFALRSALYPFVRPDLQDDFLASMQAVYRGLRCVSAPDILAYERAAVSSGDEFNRKRRIACGAFSTHRYMWRDIVSMSPVNLFKYLSHKLIRWFGVVFLATGYIGLCGVAAGYHLMPHLILATFIACLVYFAARRTGLGMVSKIMEILSAILATGIGVFESIFGVQYVTWKPVER